MSIIRAALDFLLMLYADDMDVVVGIDCFAYGAKCMFDVGPREQ